MRQGTALLWAAVFAATLLNAQEKEKPPQGSAPKPFTLPSAQKFTLKNGTRVTMVPYGLAPKVSVRVIVNAGNGQEGPNQIWLADFTGEILKEGTATRTAEQIAQEAAAMGGGVNITVGPDGTTIGGDALSEFAPSLVGLLADVVQHPLIPASELPRIRTNFLRTLAIQRSRPSALAAEAFAKAIYGDHSYGRIYPTEAMLKAYTIDDVQRFYKSNFGAARTHVYVAGRFEPSLKQAITAAFESWESGTTTEFKVPKTTATKSFALIDRPGAAQSTIIFGLPLPPPADADYLPLVVTDSLLGGSFASRITTNIREQKGYTYSPFSSITTHYHDAHWSESADVTTAVTGAALQEIVNEIKKIRKDPPTAEELAGIKSFLAGLFVLRNSSRQGVINQLRFVDLQGLPENWLRDYVPNVLKVTPQDVQRAAETYLNPDKMALVVVGDKSKIADQLTPYSQ